MSTISGAAARAAAALSLAAIAATAWTTALVGLAEVALAAAPPAVAEPRVGFFSMLRDLRPVRLRVTEAWRKIPLVVDAERVVRDPTLWNRMNFDDWDRLPEAVRLSGLERMIERYRGTTAGPEAWEEMTAEEWDAVPQPVRAMAFIQIADYWVEHYGVGVGQGLPPRDAADALAAIVMVESWFEHRAVTVDAEGNRDLGLAQASDYFRARLEELHREGWLDFRLEEKDYYNPWRAILAAAVWLDLMVEEARGDLDLALRAYRKGIVAARRGEAEEYAANAREKARRFIRNEDAPPSWDFLWRRLQDRRMAARVS